MDCCNPTVNGVTTPTPTTDAVVLVIAGVTDMVLNMKTNQPTIRVNYPLLVNASAASVTINDGRSGYNRPGSVYLHASSGGSIKYQNPPTSSFYGNITFDTNGLSPTILHGIPGNVPPNITAGEVASGAGNIVTAVSTGAGSTGTFQLIDKTLANVAVAGARGVAWTATAIPSASGDWG
jgi:hypothetical protein